MAPKPKPKPKCTAKVPLLGDAHGSSECHQHAHGSGCDSTAHAPGQCHGFEVAKTGMWTEAAEGVNLIENINADKDSWGAWRSKPTVALALSAAVSVAVMVIELFFGYMVGSLALLSDGAHQLSDVVFYAGLLVSEHLSSRKDNLAAYSFGYHRAQVLGGMVALLLQYFITGLVIAASVERLSGAQKDVNGAAIFLVSGLSVATNVLLLKIMPASHGHGHSHGGGGSSATAVARMHMLGDLVQGGVCITIGAIIWVRPDCAWLDSLSAFFYAAMVAISTFGIFQELIHVLMERVPPEMNSTQMFNDLACIKGVVDVHCCHVWMLAPGKVVMSAHLHIEDGCHEDVLHAAQIVVKHKYGIVHSTFQISDDEDLA